MLKFLKDLFGIGKNPEASTEVPYKLEPTVMSVNPVTVESVIIPVNVAAVSDVKQVEPVKSTDSEQDTTSTVKVSKPARIKKTAAKKSDKPNVKDVKTETAPAKVKKPRVVKVKKT